MNKRSLLILTIALGAVALLLSVLDHFSAKRKANWNLPEDRSLVSVDTLRNTTKIVIRLNDVPVVTLQSNDENKWIVPEERSLYVDHTRLNRLVKALQDNSLDRFVTRNAKKMDKLNLGEKELQFFGDDGKLLASIRFGKNGKNGGVFLQRDGDKVVYLSAFADTLDVDPSRWIEKKLIYLGAEDVATIEAHWTGGSEDTLTVTQENAEADFVMNPAREGYELNAGKVESALHSIFNMRFNKVSLKSELSDYEDAMKSAITFSFQLLKDEGDFTVAFARSSKVVEKENDKGEMESETVNGPVYMTLTSNTSHVALPKDADQLVFTIPDYSFNSIPKSSAEWLTEKQVTETPTVEEPTPEP